MLFVLDLELLREDEGEGDLLEPLRVFSEFNVFCGVALTWLFFNGTIGVMGGSSMIVGGTVDFDDVG